MNISFVWVIIQYSYLFCCLNYSSLSHWEHWGVISNIIDIFYHFCFLAPHDAPRFSCIFLVPALESAITSGKLGLFYWRMVLINHDVGLSVLIVNWSVSTSRLSQKTKFWNICMDINPCKNKHIHAYVCVLVYIYL